MSDLRPALADLGTDIAGAASVELLAQWRATDRSEAAAIALLQPFRRDGTVACSDTAGLSVLTRSHPPLVVIDRISRPKEVVHALGVGIGGRAIGRWVADNTESFFDAAVPVPEVVRAMMEVHRRIPEDCPRIGIAVHTGAFYDIGGGLYGEDADRVEVLAELWTPGGETRVTPETAALLDPAQFDLAPADHASLLVTRAPDGSDLEARDRRWPEPWNDAFSSLIRRAHDPRAAQELLDFERQATVMVVDRCAPHRPGLAGVLDGLAADAGLAGLVRAEVGDSTPWCAGGRCAIVAIADSSAALDLARWLRGSASAAGIGVRIGLDRGSVLVFPLAGGAWQFAGDAVNVAAKLAEDVGEPGQILVSDRCGLTLDGHRFAAEVSRVALSGALL